MKKILLIGLGLLITAGVITFAVLHENTEPVEVDYTGQPTANVTGGSGPQVTEVGNPTQSASQTVFVQLMTREAQNDWTRFYESSTVEVKGNGTYSITLNISDNLRIIPNLAVSAVGTTVDDRKTSSAVKAPDEFANATVTINYVKVNNTELTLTDNEDIAFIADSGSDLHGFANFQLWNGWWQPNQRIVPEGMVSLNHGSGTFLEFSQSINSIEIEFTISGVLSSGETAAPTSENSTPPETAQLAPATYPPKSYTPSGNFNTNLSAEQLVREISIGWNLGNTLDAYPSDNPSEPFHWVDYNNMFSLETAWIGGSISATTPELIKTVKDAGFNAVRIPVTWYKMASGSPNYTIREDWFKHVQYIVDMVSAEGMYIILNTHHDEFVLRFEDPDEGERVMTAFWTQIGERFKDYSEKLIFEGLNEPRRRTNSWTSQGQWDWSGNTERHNTVNRWNQAFVNAVRATGGNNQHRHLMLATYGAQTQSATLDNFKLPNDPVSSNGISKFILSVHVYSPHRWAHDGQGSYGGESEIKRDLERVANRAAELGVPVILGEFGTVTRVNQDSRVLHAYDYIKVATEMRNRSNNPVVMACFWWDDASSFRLIHRTMGLDQRGTDIINAMVRARKGQGIN